MRVSRAYEHRFPNHPAKRTILRTVYRSAARSGRPFAWRMRNGTVLAIAPAEALVPWSVGWTCFQSGVWEPHVERALNRLLRPGDVGYDVGANLGYFSAVMARAVGPTGLVVSLEPVPETFERLMLCRELNEFPQLHVFQVAAGASDGSTDIRFDPRDTGNASAYSRPTASPPNVVTVPTTTLDALRRRHDLPAPTVIKIDVEGRELAVLEGASATLAAHRPAVIFELNETMMRQADWEPTDIASFLRRCAPYRFFRIGGAQVEATELETIADAAGYVDVLAVASR